MSSDRSQQQQRNKAEIVFRGKIFEVEQTTKPDGRVFELARRAPGVRLIVADRPNQKLLLTREFRSELNDWDYRLPGGKVFDTLDEYDTFRESGADILRAAESKAVGEGAEEAGLVITGLKLFKKSTLGATVEWDLFVFEVTEYRASPDGQRLERGEQIEAGSWFTYDQARKMILDGKMQEERIALILLQWLKTRE